MARYDKYEFLSGGFRAPLAADWLTADLNKVCAVSLDAAGKVVKGTAGQSGFVGVLCITGRVQDVVGKATGTNFVGNKKAGDIVDIMQEGEIVELTGLAAGTKYSAVANGDGLIAPAIGLFRVGWTVEATRLIVRCNVTGQAAAA